MTGCATRENEEGGEGTDIGGLSGGGELDHKRRKEKSKKRGCREQEVGDLGWAAETIPACCRWLNLCMAALYRLTFPNLLLTLCTVKVRVGQSCWMASPLVGAGSHEATTRQTLSWITVGQ